MARDLNKVMITGRLGRDPELRYTQSGEAVATFSVASNRAIRDEREQSGWRNEAEWFRVVAWGELGERAAKVLAKGSRVYVEGRLQTQEYTDKQGQKQRSIEVIANDCFGLDNTKSGRTRDNGDEAAAEEAEEDWETGAEAYYPKGSDATARPQPPAKNPANADEAGESEEALEAQPQVVPVSTTLRRGYANLAATFGGGGEGIKQSATARQYHQT